MFLLTVCVSAAAQTAANSDFSTIRLDGIGPVRIGMTLSELNKALHTSYAKPTDPDEQACTYLEVPHQPGIGLMMLDGRVARVDVDNRFTRTVEGIHIGDSEAHATQTYGNRLKVEPDYYDPENSHYLTLLPANGKLGIRFEATDGKITRYYAGTKAAISFVEGCS
jgi:hypothetical protein